MQPAAAAAAGIEDSDEVTEALMEQRVVVTPGKAFWTRRSAPGARCNYIRLCFVYVSKEELTEGIARLKAVLQSVSAKRLLGTPAGPAVGSTS
jgi:DNA-binding transcriptional MocR family regulator